jgi:7,8-dihydropterin-6-yl-methyl-4-(beta-D-ribofuranosyl)aminobenzene 5'-phosphate synthase
MRKCRILGTVFLALNALMQAQSVQQAAGMKQALEVLPRVRVTVLVENMAGGGPVLGEWGLSLLVETDGHQVLLDAGGGQTLLGNVHALKVDLRKTEAIAISHGHGDHTGGLESALDTCGPVDLFIHPAAFDTRYWQEGTGVIAERATISRQQLLRRVRKLVETKEPAAIFKGMMVTGQIPRATDFEDTGVRGAFLDENLKTPDPILDDQAVFFRVPEGVVILLGCGHAGLVNTMRYVSELTGEPRIYAVMGGTHLISASPARMQKTIEALKKYDVQKIMLSHCTGVRAFAELAAAFPGRCSWPASGARIQFGGR